MRIESIETYLRDSIALVRILADGGAEGWGQVTSISVRRLCSRVASSIHLKTMLPWELLLLRPGTRAWITFRAAGGPGTP